MDTADQTQNNAVNPKETSERAYDAESPVFVDPVEAVLEELPPEGGFLTSNFKATQERYNQFTPEQRERFYNYLKNNSQSEEFVKKVRNWLGPLDVQPKLSEQFIKIPPKNENPKDFLNRDLATQRRNARNGLINTSTPLPTSQTAESRNGFNRILTSKGISDSLNPAEVGEGDKRLLNEVGVETDDSGGTVAAGLVEVPARFEPSPAVPKAEESAATVFNPGEKAPAEITTAEAGSATADTAPVAPAKPVVAESPPVAEAAELPTAESAPKKGLLGRVLTAVGIINKPEINHTGDAFELHRTTVEKRGNEIEKGNS